MEMRPNFELRSSPELSDDEKEAHAETFVNDSLPAARGLMTRLAGKMGGKTRRAAMLIATMGALTLNACGVEGRSLDDARVACANRATTELVDDCVNQYLIDHGDDSSNVKESPSVNASANASVSPTVSPDRPKVSPTISPERPSVNPSKSPSVSPEKPSVNPSVNADAGVPVPPAEIK